MKTCTRCGVTQGKEQFPKDKSRTDGLSNRCRLCHANYYRANAAYVVLQKLYVRLNDPEGHASRNVKHKTKAPEYRKRSATKNAARSAKHYRENTDAYRDAARKFRLANPEKGAAYGAKRKSAKLNRTPPWLTDTHMEELYRCYAQAEMYRKIFGVDVHVDHIIPLQGATVSGLHVPWNLRIIKAKDNHEKKTKFNQSDALSKTLSFEYASDLNPFSPPATT